MMRKNSMKKQKSTKVQSSKQKLVKKEKHIKKAIWRHFGTNWWAYELLVMIAGVSVAMLIACPSSLSCPNSKTSTYYRKAALFPLL